MPVISLSMLKYWPLVFAIQSVATLAGTPLEIQPVGSAVRSPTSGTIGAETDTIENHIPATVRGKPKGSCRELGDMPWVRGGGGDDRIYGGKVAYRLSGEKDRDFIIGSEDGEIYGGEDADTLVGYLGADRFVYNSRRDSMADRRGRWSPTTGDTIVDFRSADGDRIDLSHLQLLGVNAPDAYDWSGHQPQPHSVWARPRSGDTVILVDVDGDARGDVVIRLLGRLRLSKNDFCGVVSTAP